MNEQSKTDGPHIFQTVHWLNWSLCRGDTDALTLRRSSRTALQTQRSDSSPIHRLGRRRNVFIEEKLSLPALWCINIQHSS